MNNENKTRESENPTLRKGDVSGCACIVTQGRKGEAGSWCVNCGVKVYEVEQHSCGNCAHHFRDVLGSTCLKKLMSIYPSMNVTYKISEGSCFKHSR
jgi:hypothetical protein